MANTRELIGARLNFVKGHAAAVCSTVATSAKPGLAAGLGLVKNQVTAVASNSRDVGMVGTAAVVVGGVVATYFLWPAAVAPAAAAATMKAPGAAGFLISRVAFVANPQMYYHILRTAGAAAAAAAFAV